MTRIAMSGPCVHHTTSAVACHFLGAFSEAHTRLALVADVHDPSIFHFILLSIWCHSFGKANHSHRYDAWKFKKLFALMKARGHRTDNLRLESYQRVSYRHV